MYKQTRFPYWLVERWFCWFCWFCWGMARYDDRTGVGPLAPRYEAFRDAVRCARKHQ